MAKASFSKTLICFLVLIVGFSYLEAYPTGDACYIILGSKVSTPEKMTAGQLRSDLLEATGRNVEILSSEDLLPENGVLYLIGTMQSNSLITELARSGEIKLSENYPGARGGIWKTANYKQRKFIVLAGSDVQGTQYAVYDYCKEILKVDAFSYWTEKKTKIIADFNAYDFKDKIIPPPEVPILCYFENDVDELANIKEPLLEYDWENYTQMINSLVRLRYNAIQLFDMLGRPEFFLREEYKKIRPDYDVRIDYIEKMIDYAHDMGMKVMIDMALGYKIKPMAQSEADCWKENKGKWISTWKYYFEETPLGKADIFSLRPRNQVWDWEYKSSCGENKSEVFNEVYAELGTLVDHYKPGSVKVVICYADGMEMFNEDFNPPKDFIIAWSDDGFGGFKQFPQNTKGHKFGAYMHAGFWLNHTVHDPYPEKIDSVMKDLYRRYNADKYWLINGQQFRPFLLNIEAFSEASKNVEAFDGESFYSQWTKRYFGEKAASYAVQSLKKLHEAQLGGTGYVQHLWEIKNAAACLSDSEIERPGREPIKASLQMVIDTKDDIYKRKKFLDESLKAADEGKEYLNDSAGFYYDYIILPVNIYRDLIHFEINLYEAVVLKEQYGKDGNIEHIKKAVGIIEEAENNLKIIYDRRLKGDTNKLWKGWYDPAIRRPNNGFPVFEDLKKIKNHLSELIKK